MHISTQNFGFSSAAKCFIAEGTYEYRDRIHQFPEIQYILDGELEIEVNGKTEHLKKGDIAVIAPFAIHTISSKTGVKSWLMIFSNNIISDFLESSKNYLNRERCVFTPTPTLSSYIKENIIDNGEKIVNLDEEKKLFFKVKAIAYAILEEYVRTVRNSSAQPKETALAKILLYINNNFKDNITRQSVAKALGYSPSYISHTIEAIPEMNFRKLLNSIRIEHAKNLLLESDFSMLDISYECGFGGERTFYRAFSEIVGISPLRFKQGGHNRVIKK